MIWKSLMNKPILAIGILFFTLFVFDDKTKEWWDAYTARFKPNTCKVALDRIAKSSELNLKCDGNTMVVEKEFSLDLTGRKREKAIYKTIANDLVQMARLSNEESLPYVSAILYKLEDRDRFIHAKTTGEHLIKFKTLQSQAAILGHLKNTVKIKEVRK